jgi:long-chain acyl-CoA synthetase
MKKKEKFFETRHITDLKDLLNQSVQLFANNNAFILQDEEGNYTKKVTYKDFKADVDALGTSFINMGLKDKFIAVMGENRYEWCVTYLAVANGTGVIVPMDKELPVAELQNLLNRSRSVALVYSGRYQEKIESIKHSLPSVKYFINMDIEEDKNGYLSYRKLIEKGNSLIASGDTTFIDAKPDPEKLSILLFTSGTTDLAKGVMLSHKNICSNIVSICKTMYIDDTDSVLSILPIHHTYECTCGFLAMIYNGCSISFNEGLKYIGKNLKDAAPSILLAVPLILEAMYKKIWDTAAKKGMDKKLRLAVKISNLLRKVGIDLRKKLFKSIHENVGGRIRLVISGAAAIDPAISKGFRDLGIFLLQGYGLTECSPIVTCNREENFKDESIGLALPGVEVKIADPGPDGIGELAVKGDNVMLGYFENPEATNAVFKDGWFYTGDLGTVDKDGFFRITGRKKNVIVTKNGKNIFPEEVEAYLNKSPYILESLVWGAEDSDYDDTYVWAQIVPDMEQIQDKFGRQDVSKEEIYNLISQEVKEANKNMPLYKRVRRFELREKEFEKTTTRKIKRYVEKVK